VKFRLKAKHWLALLMPLEGKWAKALASQFGNQSGVLGTF